jgi:hypothetical protein
MITQTEAKKRWLAVMCVCAVWTCGCATRRAPVKPVVNFIAVVRPVVPPATELAVESPPDLAVDVLQAPPQIGPSHFQPPKPHVVAPAAQEPTGAEKHVEPTIVPEVTTEELRAAQAETQRSLDLTEKNLRMAQGKRLNATQQDLVSKVRGFADNAREAMRSGDWVRAKNFSSKAEVLSEQLAASF